MRTLCLLLLKLKELTSMLNLVLKISKPGSVKKVVEYIRDSLAFKLCYILRACPIIFMKQPIIF